MKTRILGQLAGALAMSAAATAVLWITPVPASGQAKGNYKAPRTEHNTPNLQGIWEALNTAKYGIEWHNASSGIRAGKSFIVDPADGIIPYKAGGRQKQQANLKARAEADGMNKCYMTGATRFVTSGYPFQIIQTPKYIMLASEYVHMLRYVYMDRKEHTYDAIDFWNGDSIGRWDGDTLVVSTKNNNDQTWLDMIGNHHSAKLEVIERFTRTADDRMTYEATLTDTDAYARPFTIRMDLHRQTDRYAQLLEYECHVYREDELGISGGH